MKFTCLDFETANNTKAGICAAGVAVFENDQLIESLYWLVRPPKGCGFFDPEFTKNCHGLDWFDVEDEPEFPAIAPQLLERLTGADLVIAHNALFDLRKLTGTLDHFDLACPAFSFLCTWRLAEKVWPDLPSHSLDALSAHVGHSFQHHHAGSDAEAAGRVLLAMMKHTGVKTPQELAQAVDIECGRFPARADRRIQT